VRHGIGGGMMGVAAAAKRTAMRASVEIVYCKPCGYERRAQEAASALRKAFAINAKLVPGTGGIFEVRVDDRVVVKRSLAHFPDAKEIVVAVAAAVKTA
jgi:selenoprotein W-related protein